jgi:diacylglycerol O-acyltransferase
MTNTRADVERLTSADLMMLRPEDVGYRQDIGAVAILDGDALINADGDVDIDRVRAMVLGRLHRLHRFRQLLHTPAWWLGGPLWVDAPRFRVDQHVGVAPLPTGAGERELLAEVERLRARPFDHNRPLWELWLLPGLADRQVGLYVKLHHTVADGIAGVTQLATFLDVEADVAVGPEMPWTPRAMPTDRELLVDNLRRIATALAGFAHPIASIRKMAATVQMVRDSFGQEPAPSTSANRPIGQDRHVALVRSDLDRFKTVAHAHAATVNDVLMAAIAGGYRGLLLSRGEAVEGLVLRASVPVALHTEDSSGERSNDDGMMFVPLPIGVDDPIQRLELIAAETTERKRHTNTPPSGLLLSMKVPQDALWRRFDHQRWSNAYAANVPGPPMALYLAGARIREVFAIVPLMGNLTIGVGAISYDGQFNITVVADTMTCPDVDVFAAGMRDAIDRLSQTVDARQVT